MAQDMASFSGFIRKSPTNRLRRFLTARGGDAPDDFDWSSKGRGTALVRSIETLLESLTGRQQDAVTAELDLLAGLADENGIIAATQVCAGQDIDLEGLEGVGPHAFRHMLARHAAKTCTSVAETVATAQNLGHTDVLTTLRGYGQISRERQGDLVTGEPTDDVLDE